MGNRFTCVGWGFPFMDALFLREVGCNGQSEVSIQAVNPKGKTF
jgi:hypothetical protein